MRTPSCWQDYLNRKRALMEYIEATL